MEIGTRIKELRKIKGYTAEKLGKLVGVSREHISSVENNLKPVSLSTLQKICKVLDVTLAEFFSTEHLSLPKEYLELIQNAKVLNKDQLKCLNQFLKSLSANNQ